MTSEAIVFALAGLMDTALDVLVFIQLPVSGHQVVISWWFVSCI